MASVHYSTAFIDKVKSTLPASTAIHDALDRGSPEVGDMLYKEHKAIIDITKMWQNEISKALATPDQTAEG